MQRPKPTPTHLKLTKWLSKTLSSEFSSRPEIISIAIPKSVSEHYTILIFKNPQGHQSLIVSLPILSRKIFIARCEHNPKATAKLLGTLSAESEVNDSIAVGKLKKFKSKNKQNATFHSVLFSEIKDTFSALPKSLKLGHEQFDLISVHPLNSAKHQKFVELGYSAFIAQVLKHPTRKAKMITSESPQPSFPAERHSQTKRNSQTKQKRLSSPRSSSDAPSPKKSSSKQRFSAFKHLLAYKDICFEIFMLAAPIVLIFTLLATTFDVRLPNISLIAQVLGLSGLVVLISASFDSLKNPV